MVGLDVRGNGIASKAVPFATNLKPQWCKPATAVNHGDDEGAAPTGAAMNNVQMLHTQERRNAHPVGDLKRHNALAMRWASSKAWMPEKTELLVVVSAVDSFMIVSSNNDGDGLALLQMENLANFLNK